MIEFHRGAFQNARWSYLQGLLRAGVHLTTDLDVAAVDQRGVTII